MYTIDGGKEKPYNRAGSKIQATRNLQIYLPRIYLLVRLPCLSTHPKMVFKMNGTSIPKLEGQATRQTGGSYPPHVAAQKQPPMYMYHLPPTPRKTARGTCAAKDQFPDIPI